MKLPIKICVLVFLFSISLIAQSKQPAACDSRAEAEIESYFRKRTYSSEAHAAAENKLSDFVKNCPNARSHSKLKKELKIVRQERAETLFTIADYYLSKGSLSGGCLRLVEIRDRYPSYSRIKKVWSLLDSDPCKAFLLERQRQ